MLKSALDYFLSFQPYVMLPIIIFIMAMVFRVKVSVAVKSALTLGIAFIGIFMTFDYFVAIITPVLRAFVARTGLDFPVLDAGWPPLAGITWSYSLAPVLLVVLFTLNVLLLVTRFTKSLDIDIWNYWHVIFLAALIQHATGSVWLAIILSSLSFVLVLKLAEWSAPLVKEMTGMDGICIPHLSGIAHFPIAVALNLLLDRIPWLRDVKADPENLRARLGLAGEPMIIAFVIGVLLGVAGGYALRELLALAFGFSAVVFILPKMGQILGSSLIPVSEGMKSFIAERFPHLGATFVGLDVAVLISIPAVMVTVVLLMPFAILLAIVLPGIKFIPIGDLTNLMVPVGFITLATRGNILKSFIIGIPVVIMNLYYASMFAPIVTEMAARSSYHIPGYDGLFTSFLDGGNPWRSWLVLLLRGDTVSLLLVPVVILLVFITWRVSKKYVAS
ncbi:MAG: PTS galactitol transporter subunit IIC [Spirochaetae bacterium HGW-Spirochaetae-3]|jgi:PTS system galactitol-specific IIC component|nr:MAG: PTS galactitol transporter subunit IIC [Spirochaetae bacterium HGW-Spirochaetae-3]